MKKMFYFMFCMMAVLAFTSCSDDDEGYKLYPISVQLQYPENVGVTPEEGVEVLLKNAANGAEFTEKTNDAGIAKFELPEGLYEASASDKRVEGAKVLLFNGLNTNVAVNQMTTSVTLPLEFSTGGSVVIKELYFGGCKKNDGSGAWLNDKYVVLYNNSSETLSLKDFAFGMVNPFNSSGSNKDYVDGVLSYASQKVVPAGVAVWFFQEDVTLEAGKQIVVAINGAINHTTTYTNSVDLSKADYCMYDPEHFNHKATYPAPAETIPANHYLKSYKYGLGTAWPLSIVSPAFFVFNPENVELKAFVEDPNTTNNYGGNAKMGRKMVPESWVIDGVEVFKEGAKDNLKRLTATIDAGYIEFTNNLGYTIYRNVDKAATEAIKENEGKLVTGYADDPSGIDAEASIKNGARIIYMDTNNSSNDFHVRKVASIK